MKMTMAANLAQASGYMRAGHLGPPEMQPAQEAHHPAAHHDVVEVGHHEIGVVQVNVGGHGAEEQAGQPADGKETQETEGIQHGRLKGYDPLNMVMIQLRILMAVGMATKKVRKEKIRPAYTDWLLTNM
jgi:hypothetical protein